MLLDEITKTKFRKGWLFPDEMTDWMNIINMEHIYEIDFPFLCVDPYEISSFPFLCLDLYEICHSLDVKICGHEKGIKWNRMGRVVES